MALSLLYGSTVKANRVVAEGTTKNNQAVVTSAESAETISLEIKIGQMLMVGFKGLRVNDDHPIVHDIRNYHLGGVILYDYDLRQKKKHLNIKSPNQVKALIRDLQTFTKEPLLIAVDHEGGRISRLKEEYGFPSTPSHEYLGNKDDRNLTYRHALNMAKNLAELGFNMNLAPVVDLKVNPDNPVIAKLERSFSQSAEIVSRHALQYVRANRRQGILSTLKHFPGHGSSDKDSHHGMVDITKSWSENELRPFEELINTDEVDAIMTAHVFNRKIDNNYPATLSKKTLTGLLRKQMDYDGVIISDDMQMKAIADNYGIETAVIKSIEAGVDIIIFSKNADEEGKSIVVAVSEIIKNSVKTGKLSEKRIDESYRRIKKLKEKLTSRLIEKAEFSKSIDSAKRL